MPGRRCEPRAMSQVQECFSPAFGETYINKIKKMLAKILQYVYNILGW